MKPATSIIPSFSLILSNVLSFRLLNKEIEFPELPYPAGHARIHVACYVEHTARSPVTLAGGIINVGWEVHPLHK